MALRISAAGEGATSSGLGPLGGITLGWNWQAPGSHIVWGIEGDWAFADLKGDTSRSHTRTFDPGFSAFGVANASSHTSFKVNDIATITGRFGLASGPLDRTLWYVKGGAAYEKLKVECDGTGQLHRLRDFLLSFL